MKKKPAKSTLSVHVGSVGDPQFGGIVNPIYPSAAYDYDSLVRYPRYFNTPNHQAAAEKLAALENGEEALLFSTGMAAIMTSIFGVMQAGDHMVLQNDLYGGTHYAILHELNRFGMEYTMVDASDPRNFERAIRKNTKMLYVETPSNPLLKITDLTAVARIAKKHALLTMIDNTFASPVNQNPIDIGFDIVAHSGTKYIGGHSDLMCGVVVTTHKLMELIRPCAVNFGGSLDANTSWLVERSLKTIVLRVQQQNSNALKLAQFLEAESKVGAVYYPGLKNHPGYRIARKQMPGGFGGMLSFEVKGDSDKFIKKLKYIKKAVSLGGVESTIAQPFRTSHKKLSADERKALGISDRLVRLSVGIEQVDDLIKDIKEAL
ncbi:MAG: trans-sulfuration enzyme family protein [Bacteroidota bacterium]